VKLAEIKVGERYAVELPENPPWINERKTEDLLMLGMFWSGIKYSAQEHSSEHYHYVPAIVTAVGVPYGKTKTGVAIEFEYTIARHLPPNVGIGLETDVVTGEIVKDVRTYECVVNHRNVIATWETCVTEWRVERFRFQIERQERDAKHHAEICARHGLPESTSKTEVQELLRRESDQQLAVIRQRNAEEMKERKRRLQELRRFLGLSQYADKDEIINAVYERYCQNN
jgi:hypothetical protein